MVFKTSRILILACSIFSVSDLMCDLAFVTDYGGAVYSFDTDALSVAATSYMAPASTDNIAFSPDGTTVYFATYTGGDVYSFPANDPNTITPLNVGISRPTGVAISSDGAFGFIAQDSGPDIGLFSFPTAGMAHPATQLTAIGVNIANPLFIAISGDHAFVGDYQDSTVYSVIFTDTTYDATTVQSPPQLTGLAISNDGFLYIAEGSGRAITRVPLSSPTDPRTPVSDPAPGTDGLAVSNDGKTVFFTEFSSGNGIYSFRTDQGFPAPITNQTNLMISNPIDIAIRPGSLPPSITPPTDLTGSQKSNNFGLLYENFNSLSWQPSVSTGVAGYYVYRNGIKIATVNAQTLSYQDHNVPNGTSILYEVSSFNEAGDESIVTSVTVS